MVYASTSNDLMLCDIKVLTVSCVILKILCKKSINYYLPIVGGKDVFQFILNLVLSRPDFPLSL